MMDDNSNHDVGDENSDDTGNDDDESFLLCTDLEAIGEKPIVEESVGYHKLNCHDHLCFIKCLISLFR